MLRSNSLLFVLYPICLYLPFPDLLALMVQLGGITTILTSIFAQVEAKSPVYTDILAKVRIIHSFDENLLRRTYLGAPLRRRSS